MGLGVGHQHQQLGRKSPTILNLAWDEIYMWDGRKATLEEQALGPMESAAEMNFDIKDLPIILNEIPGYVVLFKQAFPDQKDSVSAENEPRTHGTPARSAVPLPFLRARRPARGAGQGDRQVRRSHRGVKVGKVGCDAGA